MVKVTWHDKEFEKQTLDPAVVKWLRKIAFRGELLSKQLITGHFDPKLKAVKTAALAGSISSEVDPGKQVARYGVEDAKFRSKIGSRKFYALYVFLGTIKMPARPVLRTALAMLKMELKGK